MCGRFVLYSDMDLLADQFAAQSQAQDLDTPGFNVAPSSVISAVRLGETDRELVGLKWGLIPGWAKAAASGYRMINARADGIEAKPAFRHAFRRQRCLIPANGFYEWQAHPGGKQPFYIHLLNEQLFAFAGLWECWKDAAGIEVQTCAIITTEPNALMKGIHDRMPVILDAEEYTAWLDGQTTEKALLALLDPYPADEMAAYPVATRVNSPRNQGAELIEPVVAKSRCA